jgi:hypothetical protein
MNEFNAIERKIRKNLFSAKDLINVLEIKDKRTKNKAITLLINKYKRDTERESIRFLDNNFKKIQNTVLKEQTALLKQNGIKISAAEKAAFKKKFDNQFNRRQYFNHTPRARIKKAVNLSGKSLRKDLNRLKTASPELLKSGARRLIAGLKNDTRPYTIHGRSKRAVASDLTRAAAEFMLFIAEEKGIKYVRWVTKKDNRVAKMDRERAKRITVSAKRLPGVDLRGVYTIAAAKNLIRHPFCRCRLQFVFPK